MKLQVFIKVKDYKVTLCICLFSTSKSLKADFKRNQCYDSEDDEAELWDSAVWISGGAS